MGCDGFRWVLDARDLVPRRFGACLCRWGLWVGEGAGFWGGLCFFCLVHIFLVRGARLCTVARTN